MFLDAASAARDSTITDWLTSVGTIGAVVAALVIAIWGDRLKSVIAKPRLTVNIEMRPPDSHKIQVTFSGVGGAIGYTDAYWFRLSIGNDGNVTARNVEVRVLSLSAQEQNGAFIVDPAFIPLGLIWSHSQPRSVVAARIPRDVPKHCDFCHVFHNSDHFEFDTEVTPNQVGQNVWPTRKPVGTYRGRLVVTADNAEPAYVEFQITFSGWIDDEGAMFKDGLVITLTR